MDRSSRLSHPSLRHGTSAITPRPRTTHAVASATRTGPHQLCPTLACLPTGPPTAALAAATTGSSALGIAIGRVTRQKLAGSAVVAPCRWDRRCRVACGQLQPAAGYRPCPAETTIVIVELFGAVPVGL